MKKALLILCLPLVVSTQAMANEFAVNFDITPLQHNQVSYDKLLLDVRQTQRFLQLNGVLLNTTTSSAMPTTGTCFFNDNGGAYCKLQLGAGTLAVAVDSSLNGQYDVLGTNEEVVSTGSVVLLGIE